MRYKITFTSGGEVVINNVANVTIAIILAQSQRIQNELDYQVAQTFVWFNDKWIEET